jgi:hypothetical protein
MECREWRQAQGREKKCGLFEHCNELRDLQNAGNFLTRWGSISFSRRTQLRFSSCVTEEKMCLAFKDRQVDAVEENNRFLLCGSRKIRNYTVFFPQRHYIKKTGDLSAQHKQHVSINCALYSTVFFWTIRDSHSWAAKEKHERGM